MRPYKKRLLFNHQSHDKAMEMDHSDDFEAQQANGPPNDESAEKEKDKEGEPKSRKKWKRKVSRKQFRHHNIKLFTPGEYRSSTLLKQTDSIASVSKNQTEATKDSIVESIVSSLGGHTQILPQRVTRAQEDEEMITSKDGTEENNNMNCIRNNNNVGKHQLPAIIVETPAGRRRSSENIHNTKVISAKHQDQAMVAETMHHEENIGACADLPFIPQSEVDSRAYDISTKNIRYGLKPSIRLSVDSDCSSKSGNEFLGNNQEAKRIIEEKMILDPQKLMQNSSSALEKTYMSQTIQSDIFVNQYEESCSRRNSTELPVDLSRKNNVHNERDAELMKHAEMMRQIDNLKNVAKQQHLKLQNVNSAINMKLTDNKYGSSQYSKLPLHDLKNSNSIEAKHRDNKYSRRAKDSMHSHLTNTTKDPIAFQPKECLQPETEIYRTTLSKISNLFHFGNLLKHLLRQPFSMPVLSSMSRAFLKLEAAKDDAYIPPELRLQAEQTLSETYHFILNTIKNDLHLNWNIMDTIKTFGQLEVNSKQNNSDEMPVDVIRALSINDVSKISPDSHVPPNIQMKDYRESHKPPLYANAKKTANSHNTANNSLHSYSRLSSPKAGDLPTPLEHSPPIPRNEIMFPKISETSWMHPNIQTSVDQPVAMNPSLFLNSSHPNILPAFQLQLPVPYLYNMPIDRAVAASQNNDSVGKPRSKSHKYLDKGNGQPQVKRSFSNPQGSSLEHNYPTGMHFALIEPPSPYMQPVKTSQYNVIHPPNQMPSNYLQSNVPSSLNIVQKVLVPVTYAETGIQSSKDEPVNNKKMYRHSYPDYVKRTSSSSHNPNISASQNTNVGNPQIISQEQEILNVPNAFVTNYNKDSIPTAPNHSEAPNFISNVAQVRNNTEMMEFDSPIIKEKPKTLPAVIVADKSMQITKEPSILQKDTTINKDGIMPLISDQHMSVISNIVNNKEIVKQNREKDQEENNSEFLVWLEKLKKNTKLKSKFLSQMGIIKKEEPTVDNVCIEIIDSDEEKSEVMASNETMKRSTTVIISAPKEVHASSTSNSQESTKLPASENVSLEAWQKAMHPDEIAKITVPRNLEITPIPPTTTPSNTSKPQLRLTPKHSLSKSNYIPPIALPYQHPATMLETDLQSSKIESKKTIYSPEIEPISPANSETITFTFPEVQPASAMLSPSANSAERGINLNESVGSPTYVQKRKSSDFPEYPKDNPANSNLKSTEYQLDGSKRRKSLDRPQTSISPRVAPSGKLCYVRENHMFLRYFDDTQVEMFVKNMSNQGEELRRTTGINPDTIENSFKPLNFYVEKTSKTEVVHLPKDVEFSTKEDLPDVEEFVKESSLVEKFVPKDFADFYRYVTGFQIIKNKHPVSLKTFLTMYNTNRTSELLRKYLQRLDEDSSGTVIR